MLILSRLVRQNEGDGRLVSVGYHRSGSSAPRSRTRGYMLRRRRLMSTMVAILGPFRVTQAEMHVPGSVEAEVYSPGAVAGQIHSPGSAEAEESP